MMDTERTLAWASCCAASVVRLQHREQVRVFKYEGLRFTIGSVLAFATCGGFAEKTFIEISGHKTAHIFRRYDIVDESDLAAGGGSIRLEASVTVESQPTSCAQTSATWRRGKC